MNTDEAYGYLDWLGDFIQQRNVIVTMKMHNEEEVGGTFQHYMVDEETFEIFYISLDPRVPILPALIHEGLHVQNPDAEEETIEELTEEVCFYCTDGMYCELLRKLASVLC